MMSTRGWESATLADVTKREIGRQRVRMPQKGRSKYGATKVTVDGITFDSKAEARRYQELLLLGHVGALTDLELQPTFPIAVAGVTVARYRSDFRYRMRVGPDEWQDVIEDVKSEPTKTPVYRLKKKLVEALYGIQITEVR